MMRCVCVLSVVCVAGAAFGELDFRYDDGVSNITFGPPRSFEPFGDIDMLWGNYFFAPDGGAIIDTVSFGLGDLSAGNEVSVWVFDDPDDDADPTNAVPIFSLTTTGQNLGFGFNEVSIDPTRVDGGFFVAIGHLAELTFPGGQADYPAPARFDPDGRADRSWFFYDDDIPEDDLASSGFFSRLDGPQVPIPGALAIRASGVAVPGPGVVGVAGVVCVGGMVVGGRRWSRYR